MSDETTLQAVPEVVEQPDSPPTLVDPEAAMDYGATLAYSQQRRRFIVDALLKGSGGQERLPHEKDDVNLVLKALKDMDQTAINHRRNDIEQGHQQNAQEVAEAMHQLILMQANQNPFARNADGTAATPQVPKVDPEKLGEHALVDGEMDIGHITETCKVFMDRMDKERLARMEETASHNDD